MEGLHNQMERYGNGIVNRFIPYLVLFFTLALSVDHIHAQHSEYDSMRKHTIKYDVTSYFFYYNSAIFSYERVTKPNQTFAFTAGFQQFPSLTSLGDRIRSTKDVNRTGYKIGGEYRFYLAKENKYRPPHGVYIGPYATYLSFDNTRNIEYTDESGEVSTGSLKTKLSVTNIGFQLGYQFVINNRWAIDLVFVGPSISRYSAKMDLDGNFNIDEEELLQNEVIQRLIDTFPLLDDLITDKTVERDGTLDSWSFGYRYQILIGYHFGRKKK